jgi:hypothetical protein
MSKVEESNKGRKENAHRQCQASAIVVMKGYEELLFGKDSWYNKYLQ